MVTIFMFESLALWTLSFIGSTTGYFTLCKSPGAGHTLLVQKPQCAGGGGGYWSKGYPHEKVEMDV